MGTDVDGERFGVGEKIWGAVFDLFFSQVAVLVGRPGSTEINAGVGVFYWWMVVPYVVGLYLLWKKRKELWARYVWLLLLVTPLPAALTNDPFSSQRALPMLMPMVVLIALGMIFFLKFNKNLVIGIFVLLFFSSFVMFWRSYFILLPVERARMWSCCVGDLVYEYGIRQEEKFVIDQSRQKPMYVGLAFFMELNPNELQESVDQSIKDNYYDQINFSEIRSFVNLELRNINWEEDIYSEQILVGDELAISDEQAEEHALEKVFEIKDPGGKVIFRGWRTDPTAKCRKSVVKSELCESLKFM